MEEIKKELLDVSEDHKLPMYPYHLAHVDFYLVFSGASLGVSPILGLDYDTSTVRIFPQGSASPPSPPSPVNLQEMDSGYIPWIQEMDVVVLSSSFQVRDIPHSVWTMVHCLGDQYLHLTIDHPS